MNKRKASAPATPATSNLGRRLAFLLFSVAGGGAERVMIELANALVDRGFAVDLLLICKEGPLLENVMPQVRVVDLAAGRTLSSFFPLLRYLRRERPTALVSALTAVNVAAIVAARLSLLKTRVIITEHNTPSSAAQHAQSLMARLAFRLIPLTYRHADAVVAVSHGVAKDLARQAGLSEQQIEVVYNPVVSHNLNGLAREPASHPWFAEGQSPVVLGVGRLVSQKDFPTLLRAFSLVRARRAVRLVILGEGKEREALQRLAADLGIQNEVDLPGFLANPYALMARAGVFVLSSATEGLPTVLIEAMACGTPVVATDCPSGPAEILQEGRFGQLVPVGDAPALAAAIIRTMDQPLAPDVLRARAGDFTVERSVERYLSILLGSQ